MKAILSRKHRALSGVLVTIIIMVASIVLASGVVLYGTTLFQGGAQQESITVSGIKMWVHGTDSNGLAWGAFAVRNTGDKVLSVDRIAVRGQDVPFVQWYPDVTVTSTIIQQPVKFIGCCMMSDVTVVSGNHCANGTSVPRTAILSTDSTLSPVLRTVKAPQDKPLESLPCTHILIPFTEISSCCAPPWKRDAP